MAKTPKYTMDDIAKIEEMRGRGMNWRDIGKECGCSASNIFTVFKRYKPDGTYRQTLRWFPESSAPLKQNVLTYDARGLMDIAEKWPDGGWTIHLDERTGDGWKPTHWMHLPKEPKQ
jgi:hypothetical protein